MNSYYLCACLLTGGPLMFRQITAILLLAVFATQVSTHTVMMLDYYVNTSAYLKNCENIAKPILKCKGKCQLMKKIQAEEKKEQQNPERKAENKNEVSSSRSFFTSSLLPNVSIYQSTLHHFNASVLKGVHSKVFHPPGLV